MEVDNVQDPSLTFFSYIIPMSVSLVLLYKTSNELSRHADSQRLYDFEVRGHGQTEEEAARQAARSRKR